LERNLKEIQLKVVNNKLVATDSTEHIAYVGTDKRSGKVRAMEYIVIHYTASANYDADVRTLSTSSAQASCQLVLSPEGEITQIGDLNDALWHAGRSKWRNRNGLNKYSLGIEVTCPGPVEYIGSEGGVRTFKTWYGAKLYEDAAPKWNFVQAKHKNGGPEKWWAGFTSKQIEVLSELVPILVEHYNIKEVVGHDDIAPSRKIDPGPCCPDSLWSIFEGRIDVDDEEIVTTPPESHIKKTTAQVYGITDDSNLNVRDDIKGRIIGSIPEGTLVTILKNKSGWVYMETPNGHRGWVFGKYLVAV